MDTSMKEFSEAEQNVKNKINSLFSVRGNQSTDTFHKRLGKIMWDHVGMARNKDGLEESIRLIRELRAEFWKDVKVPGSSGELNPELEKACRVADFLELGELIALDALQREESCGGHFREEYQTPEGEALRDDENFAFVAAWEYRAADKDPLLHKEQLNFKTVEVKQRNYK
jgi:succinate dehydrogenase / fumarate reductase flavoprotein subunit